MAIKDMKRSLREIKGSVKKVPAAPRLRPKERVQARPKLKFMPLYAPPENPEKKNYEEWRRDINTENFLRGSNWNYDIDAPINLTPEQIIDWHKSSLFEVNRPKGPCLMRNVDGSCSQWGSAPTIPEGMIPTDRQSTWEAILEAIEGERAQRTRTLPGLADIWLDPFTPEDEVIYEDDPRYDEEERRRRLRDMM